MKLFKSYGLMLGFGAVAALALAGCSSQETDSPSAEVAQVSDEHGEGHDHEGHAHEDEPIHGGWWCYEHGIPEEQCALCDTDLAAELREKGDWCEEHNRPDSLCFECHPENADKFAALYEAKYGKRPPQPTE